jgi:hypothetical protein
MNLQGMPVRIRHRTAFTLRRMAGFAASLAESAFGIRRFTIAHSSSLTSSNSNLAPIILRTVRMEIGHGSRCTLIPPQTPVGVWVS